jgi:hypothetical protein
MRARPLFTMFMLALAIPPCFGSDPKAVLWQPPGEITLRDWVWGSGGEARAPKSPYEYMEEDLKGTNPKIRVRDANGNQWIVKFGGENHSDVFGSRLLHALGYVTEPSYFVAGGVVTGAHDLKRAKPFLGKDGAFVFARFKLRDHKTLAHVDGPTWSWNDNPFVGTQELNGLKIVLMLTSNWDAKDARDGEGSNTAIYSKEGSPETRFYAFDDWGATMGKWGGFFGRDKWDPVGYQKQTRTFVQSAAGKAFEWGYRGKHDQDITSGITVRDIKWLLTVLSRVTDEQLKAGLRASGAREPEVGVFAQSIRDRISQLQRVAGSSATAKPPLANVLRFPAAVR